MICIEKKMGAISSCCGNTESDEENNQITSHDSKNAYQNPDRVF